MPCHIYLSTDVQMQTALTALKTLLLLPFCNAVYPLESFLHMFSYFILINVLFNLMFKYLIVVKSKKTDHNVLTNLTNYMYMLCNHTDYNFPIECEFASRKQLCMCWHN